jgi:hypothetical protein
MSNSNGAPQFTVNKTDLQVRELSLAVGAVRGNAPPFPSSANIKLVCQRLRARRNHCDGPRSRAAMPVRAPSVKQPGESTLPAKRLLDYCAAAAGWTGRVQVRPILNWATISAGVRAGASPGLSTGEFPAASDRPDTTCELPSASWRN